MKPDNFAVFILTNGRPDRVITYTTLRRSGYTGPIYLLVDDLDPTRNDYVKKFGAQVVIFDKKRIAATFDQGDNFNDMRAIVYARNASFNIAAMLGIRYFIQLDDDYHEFQFRFDASYLYHYALIHNLDSVFSALIKFLRNTSAASVAFAQGGDFIGGQYSDRAECIRLYRKCMNSFVCDAERPFQFIGRINEDVNTYTRQASVGLLMFTTNQISIIQGATQQNAGGMSEHYLAVGTYVKSFYTVMFQPSSVKIHKLYGHFERIHHRVDWRRTVPKILSMDVKKK